MNTYYCRVEILETHYVYVDEDNDENAISQARAEAFSNTPDELKTNVTILSKEHCPDENDSTPENASTDQQTKAEGNQT